MHSNSLKFFCFINCFDKLIINKLSNTTSVIYRNYEEDLDIKTILRIKKACNSRNIKFYLSNNIKLAIRLGLDGAYIPSFNKNLSVNSYSFRKNFIILGSAHNLKEIRLKEQQNIDYLFLSPLFPSKKNKRCLGIYRFLKLKNLTKKKMICLGGINSNNLKIINRLRCYGIASISFFKN